MRHFGKLIAGAALVAFAAPVAAQTPSGGVLLRDSFPIGSDSGLLCQVQDRSVSNPAAQTIFDRRWAVVCRDSAQPVATIYAFKGYPEYPSKFVEPFRREQVDCSTGPISFIDHKHIRNLQQSRSAHDHGSRKGIGNAATAGQRCLFGALIAGEGQLGDGNRLSSQNRSCE